MIEILAAKSGDRTISLDGKLLASRFDPRAEAERWCEKVAAELHGIKSAIIIGAGAGYHLAILKKKLPHINVICLEFSKEVVNALKDSIEIPLLGVDLIHHKNWQDSLGITELRTALKNSYRIITHPSAQVHSSEKANELALNLNGRTELGFMSLLQLRNEIDDISLSQPKEGSHYSIFDLSEYVEGSQYQVVRELVK